MPTDNNAYIGPWWNYSNNILTLTLREQDANILSTTLIIFLGFVASQSWNILKLILHQSRASRKAQDGFHHQQQAVLRNSAGHAQALWLLTRVAFGWKKRLGGITVLW
jgi:hypothetical protein